MWRYQGFRKTGKRHLLRGLKCQDQIHYQKKGACHAIALTDGRGDTDENASFGKKVAEYITEFLLTYYDRILSEDPLTVSYNFFYQLQEMMDLACMEEKIDKEELASTILGACINTENETYCYIHLGDGMILGHKKEDCPILLSQPENGARRNETILTTAECAMKHLKIEKGCLRDINGIVLVSDGMMEDPFLAKEILFSDEVKNGTINPGMDDISIIRLEKDEKC